MLRTPEASDVFARALETAEGLKPGDAVWVCMAQEHPRRDVYRGVVVSDPYRSESGRWLIQCNVGQHADFPGRTLVVGRDDLSEWVARILQSEAT